MSGALPLHFPRHFFFPHPATPHTYPLSLHDALPISRAVSSYVPFATAWESHANVNFVAGDSVVTSAPMSWPLRSEEHTSELQSHHDLVCRLLLEKKKNINPPTTVYSIVRAHPRVPMR